MNPIKKVVCTLNIDDYAPEIRKVTFPWMQKYAEKIGADFRVITERKFPGWPVVYEKLQIGWLAEGYDWSIYFDADALIHPETIDYTTQIHKDTVLHNGHDMASIRWKYDEYFLRDGRNIGSCNWFTIASDWTRKDLYKPLDIPLEKALENIHPIPNELKSGITREHLIDDYTLSRNIARYGLKFKGAMELQNERGLTNSFFFYHQYTVPIEEKVVLLKRTLTDWGL